MTSASLQTMQRLAANTRPGYSFEQEFYTSNAVFEADMAHVIGRKWLMVGHVAQIRMSG